MGKLRKIEIYHNLTVNAPKGSYEWTKKLGQQHICLNTPQLKQTTLCGQYMLGNNYADIIPPAYKTQCLECQKLLYHFNKDRA
mgnify:FL=1|tara:strand:+ start:1351 stop:1599 length:249 start_codon:yes stop_codon:yes gene_type:complete